MIPAFSFLSFSFLSFSFLSPIMPSCNCLRHPICPSNATFAHLLTYAFLHFNVSPGPTNCAILVYRLFETLYFIYFIFLILCNHLFILLIYSSILYIFYLFFYLFYSFIYFIYSFYLFYFFILLFIVILNLSFSDQGLSVLG